MGGDEAERRLEAVYGATEVDVLAAIYDEWAAHYEADMLNFGYRNFGIATGLVTRHVSVEARLLDAGCGTGLLGELLGVLGYSRITGVDLSAQMLACAGAKDAYVELLQANLCLPLEFADGHFDAVVSLGVLTAGHVPAGALDELVRVVRPGGHLIFTLTEVSLHQLGFAAKLREIENAGGWILVERTPQYRVMPHSSSEGALLSTLFVFQRA